MRNKIITNMREINPIKQYRINRFVKKMNDSYKRFVEVNNSSYTIEHIKNSKGKTKFQHKLNN